MTEAADRSLPVAWLAVVCTDRGTHKRTRLCDVRWYPDGQWYATDCGSPGEDENSWDVLYPESDPGAWLYQFYCRRCGRAPRVGRDNWTKVMEALHPRTWGHGVAERDLDVSLLPF